MKLATWIRALFGDHRDSPVVALLKEALAKSEKERDYFRERAERLELMLLPERTARPVRVPGNRAPIGQRTWAQVQAEHAEKLKKEAEAEKQKKDAQTN
jgi:hypothetical protein